VSTPPDLVAYWDFNAGVGYSIKDVTNHGHDLIATKRPNWEVVRWLSTCGNGVVEGKEECDDGDLQDNDGCSSLCKIEAGWSCAGHPSKCVRGSGGGPAPAPRPPAPAPSSGGSGSGGHGGDSLPPSSGGSGGGRSSRRSGGGIAAAVLVPVFFLVLVGGLFAYRGAVYEQFPQVEQAVSNMQAAMGGVFKKPDGRYAALALDPEELDISPEFLSPTPARPPGSSGPYSPLP
jgi:cysteine-rich repeat protein